MSWRRDEELGFTLCCALETCFFFSSSVFEVYCVRFPLSLFGCCYCRVLMLFSFILAHTGGEKICEVVSVFHLNPEIQLWVGGLHCYSLTMPLPLGPFLVLCQGSGEGKTESKIHSLFWYLDFYKRTNHLWDYVSFSVSLCLSPDEPPLVKTVQSSEVGNKKTRPTGWAVFSLFPTKVLSSSHSFFFNLKLSFY